MTRLSFSPPFTLFTQCVSVSQCLSVSVDIGVSVSQCLSVLYAMHQCRYLCVCACIIAQLLSFARVHTLIFVGEVIDSKELRTIPRDRC